ncbi:nuclear transport factor 2 family protein [Nocardioides sp. SYSU DS0651]|uniref:nuclear transport factor 2 family protein n=1 Tax=Nocardioides sp. SYSU DS0651 TaxID=3415955 RepID=UPI003F4C24E7
MGTPRSTEEVLESHLRRRQAGDLEGDLATNYADDVILLSAEGVHRGHDGVRALADVLRTYVADGTYRYLQVLVEGEVGMLQWTARDQDTVIHDGADSYLVRDGRIRVQTIHYSATRRS